MDEIQTMDAIEAVLADDAAGEVAADMPLTTVLHGSGGRSTDEVRLSAIRLDVLVLAGCPWMECGAGVEIHIEDAELRLSYRFKARVVWTREEGPEQVEMGLEIVGVPVLVRRGPPSQKPNPAARKSSKRRTRPIPAVAA